MFKILIIGRNNHPDGKETASQIYEGLKNLATPEVEYSVVYLKDVVFDISNQSIKVWDYLSGKDLRDFDAVLMTNWFSHASIRKDIAFSLALYFKEHNIPILNTESLHSRSTSKLSQMMIAALAGIPIPRTLLSISFKALIDTAQKLEGSELTLPLIFKDAQASRGNANYLVKDWEQALSLEEQHGEKHPFMIQSVVESDNTDYRFFVTAGQTRFVIHRIGNGESHLTNTSAGASTKLLNVDDFPQRIIQDVTKASELLHREVTGIDIMIDTSGKHYFLEANPIPQIATGSNITKKLSALEEGLVEMAQSRKG